MTKKCYHVGLTVPSDVYGGWNKIVMLCGKQRNVTEDTWDPPMYFLEEEDTLNLYKCPKCLSHPDLPLLLLGGLP